MKNKMKKNISNNIYELFASALSYPNEEVREKIDQIHNLADKSYPGASEAMTDFFEFAKITSMWKWEEIYTRTFDVQAITTLDVGYVLFGDDYKRGESLVNLSKEHANAGNDCQTELADHLPNLLRLLTKLNDNDIKDDLVLLIIKPALKKIIDEFDNRNIEKKNKIYEKHHRTIIPFENNYGIVYKSLLQALLLVLNTDFPDDKMKNADNNITKTNFAIEMEVPD